MRDEWVVMSTRNSPEIELYAAVSVLDTTVEIRDLCPAHASDHIIYASILEASGVEGRRHQTQQVRRAG